MLPTNPWPGTCCYEGCDHPSEWPGKSGNVCQEHWETECDELWWKYVRAFDPELWLEDEEEYDMEKNELIQLIELAVKMRTAQKDYFRSRSVHALQDSKMLEREFDRRAKEVLGKVKEADGNR